MTIAIGNLIVDGRLTPAKRAVLAPAAPPDVCPYNPFRAYREGRIDAIPIDADWCAGACGRTGGHSSRAGPMLDRARDERREP